MSVCGPAEVRAAVFDSGGRACPIAVRVCTRAVPTPPQAWEWPADIPEPEGRTLLVVGPPYTPGAVLAGYRLGFFPWPQGQELEFAWCSPDPRAILPLDGLSVTRRLGRTIRAAKFGVTVDAAFEAVMRGCAERAEGTWITEPLVAAYVELHRLGWAHSFEVWAEERLVGGLYGVGVGAMFGAESMFSRERDASKVAMAAMVQHCRAIGVELIDIQVLNAHTERMGGIEISRREYLERLARALRRQVSWLPGRVEAAARRVPDGPGQAG